MHQLRTQVGIEILSHSSESTLFRGSDRCSLAKSRLRQRDCKYCHSGMHLQGSLYSFGCCKILLRVGIGGALSPPTPSTRAASFTIEVFRIYHPVRTGLSVNHEHVELSEARQSMRELRTLYSGVARVTAYPIRKGLIAVLSPVPGWNVLQSRFCYLASSYGKKNALSLQAVPEL
eukprot:1143833-Rhodomonas_salina.1